MYTLITHQLILLKRGVDGTELEAFCISFFSEYFCTLFWPVWVKQNCCIKYVSIDNFDI